MRNISLSQFPNYQPFNLRLDSESEGLEKSRFGSNLKKISVPAHLIFFSVCHLNCFQIYGINFEKNSGDKLKKKSGVKELKFF